MMSEDTFRVVVVGAGISGLFIAEKLKQARIDFKSMEAPTRSAERGETTHIRAYMSTSCRGNMNFRSG